MPVSYTHLDVYKRQEQYISNIENDVHGRQEQACKIMKHLNKEEKDASRLNIIGKEEWVEHYKKTLRCV